MDHLQCYLLFPFHSDLTGLLNYRNRCPPPEEKIALVIGPIAFTKQEAYIEASTLVPIAGDPADPRYKETVPDLPSKRKLIQANFRPLRPFYFPQCLGHGT